MAWPTTSRHERGYGTAWDKLRLTILKRDKYLCRCDECKKAYRLREATQVDHRIPKAQGGTDDPNNLCAINAECHKRKTDIENGRRLKPVIGADGWPSSR
jgi:5-methylcytosine-specific restriction protein A